MDKDRLIEFLEKRCSELWNENESLKFQLSLYKICCLSKLRKKKKIENFK